MRRRLSPIERHDRALTRMVPGTLGGRVESAAPVAARPPRAPRGGSGGKRFATVVVAPSNASDQSKAGADIVLDGSGDESGFVSAAGMLPSLDELGKILVTEGDVKLSDSWTVPAGVLLEGYGAATKFLVESVAGWSGADQMLEVTSQLGAHLRNFFIAPAESDGGTTLTDSDIVDAIALKSGAQDVTIEGVEFGPSEVFGVSGYGGVGRVVIANNRFVSTGSAGYECVDLLDNGTLVPADIAIVGNVMIPAGGVAIYIRGVDASQRAAGIAIAGNNIFDGWVSIQYAKSVVLDAASAVGGRLYVNGCSGVRASVIGGGHFDVQNSDDVQIAGKFTEVGSSLVSSADCDVDATFTVKGALTDHVLKLDDADHNTVRAKITVDTTTGTHNTYDGVFIDNDSDANDVQLCTVRGKKDTTQLRYGIRVNSADCDDNLVTNNDLKDAGATASFSDAGTGTVTTAGNRT